MMKWPDALEWSAAHASELGDFVAADLLAEAGSERAYWRLRRANGSTLLMMAYGPERAENAVFAPMTHWLLAHGLRVPQIFLTLEREEFGWIWLEDFGGQDLLALVDAGDGQRTQLMYEQTVRELACWHGLRYENLPPSARLQLQPAFDEGLYVWEQEYFWQQAVARFSSWSELRRRRAAADGDLRQLARELAQRPRVLVHRDFQSTNVMVLEEGTVGVIDYQGLREGLAEYDLASLLYDPYVEFSAARLQRVLAVYGQLVGRELEELEREVKRVAIQRLMQAIGAYAKLGVGDGKVRFLRYMEPAVARLRELALEFDYGALVETLDSLDLEGAGLVVGEDEQEDGKDGENE